MREPCDLFAHFAFNNVGTNTAGDTFAVVVPGRTNLALTYALDSTASSSSAQVSYITMYILSGPNWNKLETWNVPKDLASGYNATKQFRLDRQDTSAIHFQIGFTEPGAKGTLGVFYMGGVNQ